MLNNTVMLFIGGSVGSGLRFLISFLIFNFTGSFTVVFAINMLICCFLGFVAYYLVNRYKFTDNLKI